MARIAGRTLVSVLVVAALVSAALCASATLGGEAEIGVDGDDAYSFRWSGGTELEGVGVREDNTVAVVANPVGQMSVTCGSITYTKNRINRGLVGTFYTPDSLRGATPRRQGEENATPRE